MQMVYAKGQHTPLAFSCLNWLAQGPTKTMLFIKKNCSCLKMIGANTTPGLSQVNLIKSFTLLSRSLNGSGVCELHNLASMYVFEAFKYVRDMMHTGLQLQRMKRTRRSTIGCHALEVLLSSAEKHEG